jgi:hypothetical protein
MTEILLFILLSYGISNIIIYGSIFEGWRKFWLKYNPTFMGKLFQCFICLPTWIGFFLSFCLFSPTLANFVIQDLDVINLHIPKEYIGAFFDGCFASGTAWLVHTLQEALERHGKK